MNDFQRSPHARAEKLSDAVLGQHPLQALVDQQVAFAARDAGDEHDFAADRRDDLAGIDRQAPRRGRGRDRGRIDGRGARIGRRIDRSDHGRRRGVRPGQQRLAAGVDPRRVGTAGGHEHQPHPRAAPSRGRRASRGHLAGEHRWSVPRGGKTFGVHAKLPCTFGNMVNFCHAPARREKLAAATTVTPPRIQPAHGAAGRRG